MKTVRTKAELKAALAGLSGTRALVMTMGALHEGHLSLVREAAKAADNVCVSIYVNPLQFAPGEDYESYPRRLEADLALLEQHNVALVYAPLDEDIYPRTPLVRIDPGPVARILEGKTRPTHFAGVLQIVHKVISLVQPQKAFFGQKDAQQLALIRTMAADLDLPVEICSVPIRREASGLALSSRNAYLSAEEKKAAETLSQSLFAARSGAAAGLGADAAVERIKAALAANPLIETDYVHAVDPDTFLILDGEKQVHGRALLVLAARVGSTRLIDNLEVDFR